MIEKLLKNGQKFSDCKIDYVIYAIIECHDQKSFASKHCLKIVNFAKNAKIAHFKKNLWSTDAIKSF